MLESELKAVVGMFEIGYRVAECDSTWSIVINETVRGEKINEKAVFPVVKNRDEIVQIANSLYENQVFVNTAEDVLEDMGYLL